MARLLCLDVNRGIAENALYEVECNELEDFYKALNCDCFDITQRIIGGKVFDIYCDDEGLLKANQKPSTIVQGGMNSPLVGNLIFANHDAEGETVSLTAEDFKTIRDNIGYMGNVKTGEMWMAVQVE